MSEDTHSGGRSRGWFARLGDVPVVVMLAWAGWLAVPWSFSGLAQARAAAAAAAEAGLPPAPAAPEAAAPPVPRENVAGAGLAAPGKAWGLPAARDVPATVLRAAPALALSPAPADTAREAFAAERAWIAGEVHDAAGHGLAAIAMQAGVALVTLDDDPEQARVSLHAIRETSLTALAQLRAALDRLDPRSGEPAGRIPYVMDTADAGHGTDAAYRTDAAHRAADSARGADGGLGALVDGVRAAGLRVEVEPDDPAVPPPLQDAVYRVVRESLTNVLRHAGPSATARVTLSGEPGAYVVEVVNHAAVTREPGGGPGTGGRGLAGMRAGVSALGGRLTAGPRDDGGFRVLARFPVEGG
ncbi:hypothetical protein HTZ77_09030 [Nonomuraea sp. SMC257]|uniref:histidine kinase n=1 Tax=Nonomuraea montanisoli TaxID=2741721 RepID=A0A7Y6I5K9_9ACTN|nr:histidine kinase [Nonomuraea montanisoli]NUW31568.1 hypothetical protein [Nonomuraea montanisoli]